MEDPKYNVSGAKHETSFRTNQGALQNAEISANEEKKMSLRETIRVYKKAVAWSMVLSTALIMEGYDVVIINSFWGQTAFLNKFGSTAPDGHKYVPANWQSAVNNAASIGQIIGILLNSYCQARFGSRKTYLCAMVAMAGSIFLAVFAQNLHMLFGAEIVMGIPWGIFQTLTTSYAAEICPIALRGYLTSYVNACWGIGLTIGAAVVRASLAIEGNWGWRMPYAVQWVWPIPLFCAVLFAPESPWWLVRKGRMEDAKKSIRRLGAESYLSDDIVDAKAALIEHTIEMEAAETAGSGWKELFHGTNRRRTEIACVVWSCQYWCGQPISNFATEYLVAGGVAENKAFDLNIANFLMIFAGTLISWAVFYRFGRRALYIWGLAGHAVLFLLIGIIGVLPSSQGHTLAIGALFIIITFVFGITVAPACYSIVAEVAATRVRAQTVGLARATYILSQAALQQLFPRFLTAKPGGWGLGGKCGFIFVAINIGLVIYCYFRLPETMGRTFGEIDIMFQNKVPAKMFKSTVVDEFQADRMVQDAALAAEKDHDIAHVEQSYK